MISAACHEQEEPSADFGFARMTTFLINCILVSAYPAPCVSYAWYYCMHVLAAALNVY